MSRKKLYRQLALLFAGFAAVLAVAAPQAASAAPHAVPATTSYYGTWNFSAVVSSDTVSTKQYVSSTTASSCTTADGLTAASYHFKLIWYNGGKDTVLWSSPEYGSSGVRHCSPTKTITGVNGPKIFDKITLDCQSPIDFCQGNGTYGIRVN